MPTLDHLNTMPPDDFVAALDGVFEHAPGSPQAAAAQRPFASVTALHDALMAAVHAAPADACLGFSARPSAVVAKSARRSQPDRVVARPNRAGLGMTSLGDRLARVRGRLHRL